jgi:hypothetical protein
MQNLHLLDKVEYDPSFLALKKKKAIHSRIWNPLNISFESQEKLKIMSFFKESNILYELHFSCFDFSDQSSFGHTT